MHRLVHISLLLLICNFSKAETFNTDSLELLLNTAKPGWDRIDYAVGLARLYHTHKDARVKMTRMIDIIYQEARTENIPDAVAYGLIMESIIAGVLDNDADKREEVLKEAMAVALKYANNDAYVFAGYQLAQSYWNLKGDFPKAKEVCEDVLLHVDNTVDDKHLGNFYKTIGYVYTRIGLEDKGFEYLNLAIIYLERMKSDPFISPKIGRVSAQYGDIENLIQYVYNMISESKLRLGYPKESRENQLLALEMALAAGVPFNTAWQYERIGMHFEKRGYFEQSIAHYKEANKVFEGYPDNPFSKRTNTNIARVMLAMNATEDAKRYVFEIIPYYESKKDTLYLSRNLVTLSKALLKSGQLDSAWMYIEKLTAFEPSLRNPETKGTIYQTKAQYFLQTDNVQQATLFAQKAIDIYEESKNRLGLAETYPQLARAQIASDNLLVSYTTATKGLNYAKNQSNVYLTRQAYLLLSDIDERLNRTGAALMNYKLFMAFNDSVYTVDAQLKLKEEQVRKNVVAIQNEKREAETTAFLLQVRNNQYFMAGAIMLALLILVGYLAISFQRVKSKVESQNLQLSKLNQTKDKFFGIIAHDLRSPLVGLQSVGDQINYFIRKKQPEKAQEVAEEIEKTSKRLSVLLDNLLNWALMQNGMIPCHPKMMQVYDHVDQVYILFKSMAEMKEIALNNKVDPQISVYTDAKALETILRNLISNALKFTSTGGAVTVQASTQGSNVEITITDTGVGIAPEKINDLFELAKTSESGTAGEKGSGLGLMLCKELVEMNNGTINVSSQLGKGTQFIFTLPKAIT